MPVAPFARTATFAICLVAAISLAGCSSRPAGSGPAETPAFASASTPAPGPLTLRVISYNVLWGGGFERRFDANLLSWQKPLFSGRDRLPGIIDLLDAQAPDVLGIQEAAAWEDGESPVAGQVAARLGMSFAFAANDYEINTALYSTYRILSWLDLTPYMGSNSALVAVLRTPDGQPLVVAVAHLDPFTGRMRDCQVNLVLSVLQPLKQYRALILGDMNFRPDADEFQTLLDAGWELIAIEPSEHIDQVWTREGSFASFEPLWARQDGVGVKDGQRLSDHYPVGVAITFPERRDRLKPPRLFGPKTVCSA